MKEKQRGVLTEGLSRGDGEGGDLDRLYDELILVLPERNVGDECMSTSIIILGVSQPESSGSRGQGQAEEAGSEEEVEERVCEARREGL